MVCPYSMGLWGGVQSQVMGLARTLRRRGTEVQVLAPCDGMPPEPWVTPLGDSMPYSQNGSVAPVAPDPSAQLRTMRAIWNERFDVIHLHEPLAPGPTLTSLVVKPAPLVGTFHANGDIGAYRYLRPLLRRLATRLDVRVAVSSEAAAMARGALGGDYEVLFNGVDLQRFQTVVSAELIGDAERPSILFLGRHEPRKGLEVLLEAARQLPPEVEIWVAGVGPETNRLQAAYRDLPAIQWLGQLSEREKLARLAAASVFCVPSVGGESFGVVLLEAMAAGTPVVASDIEAYRLTSRGGRDAILTPTGDAAGLAAGLRTALWDTAARSDLVQSGRSRAEEFSMERLSELYLERYHEAVARARSVPGQGATAAPRRSSI